MRMNCFPDRAHGRTALSRATLPLVGRGAVGRWLAVRATTNISCVSTRPVSRREDPGYAR